MPIESIIQPEVIDVDCQIRLRKYDGICQFALSWYQDEETLILVDGKNKPYDMEKLERMYNALNRRGELYFIEVKQGKDYEPVGDVTFSREDMPIVIGNPMYRRKGIGRKVVEKLVSRGVELGYSELYIDEIYEYNVGSIRLFESLGFQKYEDTEKGGRYRLRY